VHISLQGNTVQISDDGPGCPSSLLTEITQRGFRADENTPGSGLGLAIAQDIAGTYGAELEFANNAPGLAVRVTFKPGALV
jgi:signal transduction histidine kinase